MLWRQRSAPESKMKSNSRSQKVRYSQKQSKLERVPSLARSVAQSRAPESVATLRKYKEIMHSGAKGAGAPPWVAESNSRSQKVKNSQNSQKLAPGVKSANAELHK